MAGLKVVMWNSGGLRAAAHSTEQKMAFFDKEFPGANFSVAAFLETHHKSEDDFPDLIKEYMVNHHCIHAPTPLHHKHSGIIILVNKQYDVLHSQIEMPGRMLNLKLAHKVSKHEYNLTVYYAPQVKTINKTEMVNIVKIFSQVHDVSQNNIIIGDFNFADKEVDKGKGMSVRDKMMNAPWEEFKSETAMVDPFRVQSPKRRIYSFVSNAGKSRGDRVYVNEENVPNITNHKYSLTPFNNAHKILSFTFKDQQERGSSYWKLNSSILNDNAYIEMVRQTIVNVDKLYIPDKQKWWDIFLACIRSKTIAYTKRKHFIENSTRYKLKKDLLNLEALPSERLTPSQTAYYNFLKEKLKIFEEKLIAGYRQRTRGLPKYEQREPDIEFYAKLEKRSAQRTVIGELRDKNGDVYADNPSLIHIVTDFYTELYTPSPVDASVQEKLLGNVDHTLTDQQKCMLDAVLSEKELQQAVYDLKDEKSPGIDGFTAEFYKNF